MHLRVQGPVDPAEGKEGASSPRVFPYGSSKRMKDKA